MSRRLAPLVDLSRRRRRDAGEVASANDLRRTARSLRKVVELTEGLPEDSPADARLRDRLELAADVLEAAAGSLKPSEK